MYARGGKESGGGGGKTYLHLIKQPNIEEHPHKTQQTPRSPKEIMLVFLLARLIYQDFKQKPPKEAKDALFKLYFLFKDPPERGMFSHPLSLLCLSLSSLRLPFSPLHSLISHSPVLWNQLISLIVTPMAKDIERYLLDTEALLSLQKIQDLRMERSSRPNAFRSVLQKWTEDPELSSSEGEQLEGASSADCDCMSSVQSFFSPSFFFPFLTSVLIPFFSSFFL